jgi:hypothetical protein
MPITPGECSFTVIAGVTLPTCPPFTAKDCILVNKVYDQCFTEDLVTEQVAVEFACPGVTIPAGATISCVPIPGTEDCQFAGTVAVTPPLTPFFEDVLILNSFAIRASIFANGVTICAPTLTLTGAVRANLWLPPGTAVSCNILSFGDCTCTILSSPTGLPIVLACTGKMCKEIQVTAPVKLLVPSYGFCELPACTFSAQPGFVCPTTPLFPPQRCQTPPTVTVLAVGGAPLIGTTISIIRTVNGVPTIIASANTDILGSATFPTIGGLEAGLDVVQFISDSKVVQFPIPPEFVDVAQVAHDSATVCSLLFVGVAEPLNTYTVFINGFLLGTGELGIPQLIDP